MKKNIILLGDKIITTKTAECKEKKQGIIICYHRDDNMIYGVKFDYENPFFHKLQYDNETKGILNENKGLWLRSSDFKVIPTKNNTKRKFNSLMTKNFFTTIKNISQEIKQSQDLIESIKRTIKERQQNNKRQGKEIEQHQELITALKKQKNPEIENYYNWYEKLLKHPNIEKIIIKDNYLIIKTGNLTYHHCDNKVQDFNLGAYYLYFSNELSTEIRAINYKKQFKRGTYFHPCIKEGGQICMGDIVKKEIHKYRKENQIVLAIFLLINFLKDPNYSSPYLYAEEFRCAQQVTYKPNNIFDYLSYDNWQSNETWDEKQLYIDSIKFYQKDIEIYKEKNIHLNLIAGIESKIEHYNSLL